MTPDDEMTELHAAPAYRGPSLSELMGQVRAHGLLQPNPNWTDTEKLNWCQWQLRQQSEGVRGRLKRKMQEKQVILAQPAEMME